MPLTPDEIPTYYFVNAAKQLELNAKKLAEDLTITFASIHDVEELYQLVTKPISIEGQFKDTNIFWHCAFAAANGFCESLFVLLNTLKSHSEKIYQLLLSQNKSSRCCAMGLVIIAAKDVLVTEITEDGKSLGNEILPGNSELLKLVVRILQDLSESKLSTLLNATFDLDANGREINVLELSMNGANPELLGSPRLLTPGGLSKPLNTVKLLSPWLRKISPIILSQMMPSQIYNLLAINGILQTTRYLKVITPISLPDSPSFGRSNSASASSASPPTMSLAHLTGQSLSTAISSLSPTGKQSVDAEVSALTKYSP